MVPIRPIKTFLRRCQRHWVLAWLGVLMFMWIFKLGVMMTNNITGANSAEPLRSTQLNNIPRANPKPDVKKDNMDKTINDVAKCVSRPKKVNHMLYDIWYTYYNPPTHSKVYIFSAYMDDRPQNKLAQVRLLAISSTIVNTTYCQLWYEDLDEPVITKLHITKNGRGHKISRVHYEQYYFTCDVTRPRPVMVSVTSRQCETPQSLVPVTYPHRGIEHEFAVCVPITFGTVDAHRLVEWTEAHRLLGVTEISIYYVHMSEEVLKPFRYYESLGIMKLLNIPTVPHWENSYDGNKLSSMVSLNDCMYRNMYRYKWLIDIDFDELIVPNTVRNYSEMLTAIDRGLSKKQAGTMSYTFRNAYFWVGCGATYKHPEKAIMLTHVKREHTNKWLYAPKSILSPLTCISLFNHYCYHAFPTPGRSFTIDVNVSLAFSHHYRKIRSKKNCETLKEKGIEDLSVLKFKDPLEKRYSSVIRDMKL